MLNDYIHEKEKQALEKLRSNGVFRLAMTAFNDAFAAFTDFAEIPVTSFPVTEYTNERIYGIYQRTRERLEIAENPRLFLQMGYELRAEVTGSDDECFIILYSRCVDEFSDGELAAVLGHALSHVKYGHVGLMKLTENFGQIAPLIPYSIGDAAKAGFQALCLEWLKYAAFTADRGAVIASGGFERVRSQLGKSLGLTNGYVSSENRFWDVEIPTLNADGIAGKLFYQHLYRRLDTPFGVIRLKELEEWCRSDSCRRLCPICYYTMNTSRYNYSGEQLYRLSTENAGDVKELEYLFASAEKNYPQAMAKAAEHLIEGKDGIERTVRNVYEGLQYLRLSALSGCGEAQFRLGVYFMSGMDGFIDRNFSRGLMLVRLAAGKGYAPAVKYLNMKKFPMIIISEDYWERIFAAVRAETDVLEYITNYSSPVDGLTADSFNMYTELGDMTGYSGRDRLYAVEYESDGERVTKSIAVTSSGVYYSCRSGLPDCVLWDEFFGGGISVCENGECTSILRKGGAEIYRCKTENRGNSLFGLLMSIYNLGKMSPSL